MPVKYEKFVSDFHFCEIQSYSLIILKSTGKKQFKLLNT